MLFMIKRADFWAIAVLIVSSGPVFADEPSSLFEPARLLTAHDEPVDVESAGHAAPFYGDFDADGKKDLLVGDLDGHLRVFQNRAVDESAEFIRPHIVFPHRIPTG